MPARTPAAPLPLAGDGGAAGAGGRLDAVMGAVLAVSAGLDVEVTLQQIVTAAAGLVDARYAALGVLGEGGVLAQFVYTGIDAAAAADLGPPPCGKGVLGVVIEHGRSLRLDDVTTHPAFTGFPVHHPPMRTFLGVPIRARGRVFGRLYLTEKTGGRGFTADDQVLVEALAAAAGVAVDNAQLYAHARRHQAWLAATAEIAADLLASSDVDQALRLVADRAKELTGSDTAVIFLPADPATPSTPGTARPPVTGLRVAVGFGLVADHLVGTVIPVTGSTSGAVFTDQQARNVPGLEFEREGVAAPLGPGLVVPLTSGHWRVGVLSLARRRGAAGYDQEEFRFTRAFAEQAALALRGAAHQRTQRDLDLLRERERIARDLHDDVIQQLFAIGLAMKSTQRTVEPAASAARIERHRHELQQVVHRIRGTIFDLAPTPGQSVRATLHQVITALTANPPPRTSIRISERVETLPTHLAQHAQAVVREAVSNAVRHAHATELAVTITADTDLTVQVVDNGDGIPGRVTRRSGLRNLADRAVQLGGSLTTGTPPAGGTHLTWTAPLHPT